MNRELLERIIKQELLLEQVRRVDTPDLGTDESVGPEVAFPNIYDLSTGRDTDLINSSSSREKVSELQSALVSLGFNLGRSGPDRDGVDGVWGRRTTRAVERFQREMVAGNPELYGENDIDGLVGKDTSAELIKSLSIMPDIDFIPQAPEVEDVEAPVTNLGRVMTPEEVPLERVGNKEPFRMDTADEPDDWDPDVAEDWEDLQPRTKGFIAAMPATIASMGHARDEDDAKDQSGRIIGSTYRSARDQARAVYNYPYKHDLRIRKQNPDLQPGDYYKSQQARREGRLEMMRQALRDLGYSGDTSGVYADNSESPYIQVFDEWEALTGGDLNNHRSNRSEAIQLLYDKIYKTYANGHGAGSAIDIPLFTGAKDVLDKAEQIAGVNYDASKEADHWHINISENKNGDNKMKNKKMSLLERNIQAFLIESDPDSDQDDSAELRDIADDLEASAPDYGMSAQLQDVMGSDELRAYGAGYDEAGDATGSEPRNELADFLNDAVHGAKSAGMDLKNMVDVLAEILTTSQSYSEEEVLDAFSSYVRGVEEGPRNRMQMRERRLFEASRGRWQKLSGLYE
jgi:peptidoglycan hydrolase-like protein with peptidoglycan-binding domain